MSSSDVLFIYQFVLYGFDISLYIVNYFYFFYLRWPARWVLCPFWQPATHVNYCIFVPILMVNKVLSLFAMLYGR